MDIFPKEKRSWIMSRIRSRNTSPENAFRRILGLLGIRHKYQPGIPGKPDFLIGRTLFFIDGDFWHGRIFLETGKLPRSNRRFWKDKILSNMRRDGRNRNRLRKLGYSAVRFWESDIFKNPQKTADRIVRLLTAKPPSSS